MEERALPKDGDYSSTLAAVQTSPLASVALQGAMYASRVKPG